VRERERERESKAAASEHCSIAAGESGHRGRGIGVLVVGVSCLVCCSSQVISRIVRCLLKLLVHV